MLAVNERYGLTPITLPAEEPIAELKVGFLFADSFFFKPCYHCFLCFFDLHTVKETGVYEHAGIAIGKCFLLDISARYYFNDRKTHRFSKIVVP